MTIEKHTFIQISCFTTREKMGENNALVLALKTMPVVQLVLTCIIVYHNRKALSTLTFLFLKVVQYVVRTLEQ